MNTPQDKPGIQNQQDQQQVRKAGLLQVMSTIFFSFVMIGKKGTWEKDGVQVTPGQVIVGGIIGAAVLVGTLLLLVRLVLKLATG